MPEEWRPVPSGFASMLKIALPFVGDRNWSAAVRLWKERITALSNTAGIDLTAPGLDLPEPLMLPTEAVTFVAAQGDPLEYAADENSITFRWEDGRWLRAQLLNQRMPDIDHVFAKAEGEQPIQIDEEYREAFADASAMSDGVVTIKPEGFEGLKGVAKSLVDFEMDVTAVSHWNAKALEAVLTCADAWNPGAYPEAAGFSGAGMRGVILGVRR
jgi:hypothetical protein